MYRAIFFLLLSSVLLSSCALNKKLNYHNDLLSNAANSNAPVQEKLDILLQSYVQMMDEGLSNINPQRGYKLVKLYHDQNAQPIEKIIGEVQQWQSKMSDMEVLAFGLNTLRKPYTKKAIDLFPKFERKYKQAQFVLGLSDKIKGGLTKVIGDKLGM
ncbi:MAG: hypothetical protein AB8G22_23300 [Saprospiraceae bacterium]